MKYTTNTIEVTKGEIHRTQRRIARQREIVDNFPREGEFGTQAQALLLIMEQSLLSMVRFLHTLEQAIDIENGKGERRALRPPHPSRRRKNSTGLPPALTDAGPSSQKTPPAPEGEPSRDEPATSRHHAG